MDQFIEKLREVADGETAVAMWTEFGSLTLHIIGKVHIKHTETTVVHVQYMLHDLLQAAFGTDFSQSWSDKALGLKYAKGNGSLGFLVKHATKGVWQCYRNAFYPVRIFNAYFVVDIGMGRGHSGSEMIRSIQRTACT